MAFRDFGVSAYSEGVVILGFLNHDGGRISVFLD